MGSALVNAVGDKRFRAARTDEIESGEAGRSEAESFKSDERRNGSLKEGLSMNA